VAFFSTEDDLNLTEQRLAELTDSEVAVGVKDTALLLRLHTRAKARVDAALYGKYVVDETDIPPILTQLEADLWKFYLYERRAELETPASVKMAAGEADKLLERYRMGEELLDAPHVQPGDGLTSSGGSFSSDSVNRIFGRAKDGLF